MGGKVFTDTSDFFAIDHGDEIIVGSERYTVFGHERERRFGIEDPKFWVKKAKNSLTGEKKLIKLSYFETFCVTIGGVPIRCFRDPDKESRVLDLVKGRPHYMQGTSTIDPKNNSIRVLDIVLGHNLFVQIGSFTMAHETYFHTILPGILQHLLTSFDAIQFLHEHGFRHGDIRNDHIIVERETGNYVWIDFDFDFDAPENPFSLDIFGLGNLLIYAVGKGFHTVHSIHNDRRLYGNLFDRLEPGDFSLLDKWRFVNLRKLYPYIPPMLNDILMHFSQQAEVYYESAAEISDAVSGYLQSMGGQ
ncbi:protein kinase [Desulfococcus sp.]|uniref:protein kinase n=1 Tax=Desulfococcus sp. TaxID=2025834 RepID=UPI0035941876